MTYPEPTTQPALPDSGSRPGSVRAAAVCFWLAAGLLVAQVPQVVFDLATSAGITREAGAATAATPTEIRNEINSARVFDVVALLVLVMLALSLVYVAFAFRRGSGGAQVMGIVAAGVVLLCCSAAAAGSVLGGHQADGSEFQRQLTVLQEARTPGWVNWLTLAALVVYPLLLAGAILLLVPASGRYFRPFARYYVYPLPPSS